MYYGNPKAPASGNGQRVFDPDYTLVYHFAEANVPARDTTAYGNNAGRRAGTGRLRDRQGRAAGRGPLMLPASPRWRRPRARRSRFRLDAPDSSARSNLYARRDGAGGAGRRRPGRAVRAAQWPAQHAGQPIRRAVVAPGREGREGNVAAVRQRPPAASLAAALPALSTPPVVGADARAAGLALRRAPSTSAPVAGGTPGALLLADATAQGADSRLVSYGADEQQAGKSHFGFILKAMPFDAWVVVAMLGLMMVCRGRS
jgi:biopolymer transport protein ExbB